MSPAIVSKYAAAGPCAAIGKEVWFFEGKRLRVGIILSVDEAKNEITVQSSGALPDDNKPIILNPEDRIIMSKKPKGMK